MKEINSPLTTVKPADRPARLRVDTSGLSQATRRELGLVVSEATEQIPTINREGKSPGNLRVGRLTRPAQLGESQAEIVNAPERINEWEVLELRRSPAHAPILPKAEREQARQTHGFEEGEAAHHELADKPLLGKEDGQQSHGIEPFMGAASPERDPRRVDETNQPESGLSGEGSSQATADAPTLPRPGQARSGDGEIQAQADRASGMAKVNGSQSQESGPASQWGGNSSSVMPELAIPDARPAGGSPREEANRWQELHTAVSQYTSRNQQLFTHLMQTLRDTIQGQAQQRAELDTLSAELRTILAQNTSAGFNRQ